MTFIHICLRYSTDFTPFAGKIYQLQIAQYQ